MEEKPSTFDLPVVDFAAFSHDGQGLTEQQQTQLQKEVAQQIDEACRGHGFLCLRNTGISRDTLRRAFAVSKDLFALDSDAKAQLKKLDPSTNTGFSGLGNEALNARRRPDLKEVFNVRRPRDNPDLFQGTPPEFDQASTELWDQVTVLTQRVAVCCAMALQLPDEEYFSKTLTMMDLCTQRMLHYPPTLTKDEANTDAQAAIRVGEHTDFGAYTFLFVDNLHDESSHGLQVKPVEGGDLGRGSIVSRDDDMFTSGWQDVLFDKQTIQSFEHDETAPVLVNTGALMARWTNDVWRATAHRVVVKPSAATTSRYSIAVFIDPDKSTTCSVHPKFVPQGEEPKYPPINSLDYLLMKLNEVQLG